MWDHSTRELDHMSDIRQSPCRDSPASGEKGNATSYGLKVVAFLFILHEILLQGVERCIDFGNVCPNERGLGTSSRRFEKLNRENRRSRLLFDELRVVSVGRFFTRKLYLAA
jgi:hypothetical protein